MPIPPELEKKLERLDEIANELQGLFSGSVIIISQEVCDEDMELYDYMDYKVRGGLILALGLIQRTSHLINSGLNNSPIRPE